MPPIFCGSETCSERLPSSGLDRAIDGDDMSLANDLNELSVQERERVEEEIHGVKSKLSEESEGFVQEKVKELLSAIAKLPKDRRKTYEQAAFLKPCLERETEFFLMFLRATDYDVTSAASRICGFFRDKGEIFGEDKLCKTICLEDLGDGAIEVIRTGSILVLENLDQAGRPVMLMDGAQVEYKEKLDFLRSCWYITMAVCRREEAQINGVVSLNLKTHPDANKLSSNWSALLPCVAIWANLPVRTVGFHFCYSIPALRPATKLFQAIVGKEQRVRMRSHFVSRMEARYTLLTFGIALPDGLVSSEQEYFDDATANFLRSQGVIDANAQVADPLGSFVAFPNSCDVLCGRGILFFSYSGNRKYETYIEENLMAYMSAEHTLDKTAISMATQQRIEEAGGRFLRRSKDGWILLDGMAARAKISEAFRSRLRSTSKHNSSGSAEGSAFGLSWMAPSRKKVKISE